MKILVISHTAAMRMMCRAWARAGYEIIELPLPTVKMAQEPSLKRNVAHLLFRQLREERPDVVVEAGGATAVLPLDPAQHEWTVDAVSVPWCVWWWDAPHVAITSPYYRDLNLPDWLEALRRPHLQHFIWDQTLGREYSKWFGRPVRWLPTAVDPQALNPEMAQHSSRKFEPVDVCFLGEFYSLPAADAAPDAEVWATRRVQEPDRTIFELAPTAELKGGRFAQVLARSLAAPAGVFTSEYLGGRSMIDDWTGVKRRNQTLMELARTFPSRRFAGKGWPPELLTEFKPVTQAADVAACYQSAMFNVELGNKQAFTGSAIRGYEIMAVGGILACRGRPDFDPGGVWAERAYVSFSSARELAEMRDQLRAQPTRLQALRETARRYVSTHHTWPLRMKTLLAGLATEHHDRPAVFEGHTENNRGCSGPQIKRVACVES